MAEGKINTNQDSTFTNAKKETTKFKKYGMEIDQLKKEYDEYVEKDPEVFNSKVKTEVDFALLRVSEQRYKAERELEAIKEILKKKNGMIRDMEIKMKQMKLEN
mmetsp:Transcript_35314/g.34325  ORF Transcript_35314/g.34325 Transcript_35314/m.34325 type:complete len:104 (-) Transcript_35314:389-700(-)